MCIRDRFQTYMVSQDKDLGQLIYSTCFLWKPGKRGNDHEVIDLAKLKEQWGIERADQVVDICLLYTSKPVQDRHLSS